MKSNYQVQKEYYDVQDALAAAGYDYDGDDYGGYMVSPDGRRVQDAWINSNGDLEIVHEDD